MAEGRRRWKVCRHRFAGRIPARKELRDPVLVLGSFLQKKRVRRNCVPSLDFAMAGFAMASSSGARTYAPSPEGVVLFRENVLQNGG
jgi:hypothetical protein